MKHIAYIGLGSNLDNPQLQVKSALQALDRISETKLIQHSALYRSAPVGFLNQPDFINAVAEVETSLAPKALLNSLLLVEQQYGRTREFRNAPRTLDLDLLLYGDITHQELGLTVPHPQMHKRAFVLQPLLEIAPYLIIPELGAVAELLQQCVGQPLECIADAIE